MNTLKCKDLTHLLLSHNKYKTYHSHFFLCLFLSLSFSFSKQIRKLKPTYTLMNFVCVFILHTNTYTHTLRSVLALIFFEVKGVN